MHINSKRLSMKKTFVLFLFVLLVFGCFEQNNPIQAEQDVAVQLLKSASIDISVAQCRVTADDMDTILVDLTVTEIMISGEISNVPYGDDRLFELFCYNSAEVMNYYGFSIVDINSIALVVNIILYPVDTTGMANVTINGTFSDAQETEEKIVFSANYSGDYDIYIMDIDGTNIERLTSSSFNEMCPQISPDRQKIVFQRGTNAIVGHECCILDLETRIIETPEPLSSVNTHYIQWHPSGTKIIFRTNVKEVPDIYEYDLLEETLTPLVQNNYRDWMPSYSSDGNSILYCSELESKFRVFIANADGTNPQMINPSYNTEERLPAMHPTNENLVIYPGRYFDTNSVSQWGIYLTDLSDSSVTAVISTYGVDEGGPQWSPDGNKIIYEQNSGGNYGIYMVNADGGEKTKILDNSGNERYPHCR